MKLKVISISATFLVLLTSINYAQPIKYQVKSSAKVTKLSGKLEIFKSNKWIALKNNSIVKVSDRIRTTKNSRAELSFSDGKKLRIAQNTDLIFVKSEIKEGAESNIFKLVSGRLWSKIINRGTGRFAVQGQTASLAVMGTTFDIETSNDKTDISVFDGSVGVQLPSENQESFDKNIDDLHLEVDDNKNKDNKNVSLKPQLVEKPYQEIEKPVKVVPGPYQVSQEQWLEIVENQKISVDNNGVGLVSNLESDKLKSDSWIKWNTELDSKTSEDSRQ
ncbi:MAG: FecR domain-containing protein [Candidatus Sericytochromatia bacterium]